MKRKVLVAEPQKFVLKDALRKCGHHQDYEVAVNFKHRAEDYALSSDCKECNKIKCDARDAKEEAKRQIALKWIAKHGITADPSIDASESYRDAVQITFYIPTV